MVDSQSETAKVKTVLDEFVIPYSFGRITDARYFGSKKVVVTIQDLHCHPEVQRNISRILRALDKRFGLSKVYVEGGIGRVDTSWTNVIADTKLRERIVESLLSSGKLTGSEYYAITSKKNELLEGLEDEQLYKDNAMRLGEMLDRKKEIEAALPAIQTHLDHLKDQYYGRQNRKLDELLAKNNKESISSDRFYQLLFKYAGKAKIDTYECPNIRCFLAVVDSQKRLNYKKISHELQAFLLSLKDRLPYAIYCTLIEKTKDVSQLDELYMSLARVAKGYNNEISAEYPELNAFFNYLEQNGKIRPFELLKEEKRLVRELHQKLAHSEAEREVVFLADYFGYFDDYLNNRISSEEYMVFSKGLGEFKALWEKYIDVGGVSSLAPFHELFSKFYDVNIERNKIFAKHVLGEGSWPDSSDVRLVPDVDHTARVIGSLKDGEMLVTVAGGFHTPGFTKLLEARNISYLVITPNVTTDIKLSEQIYDRLAKEQARLFAEQTMALHLLSQEMAKLSPDQERIAILERYLEAALTQAIFAEGRSPKEAAEELNGHFAAAKLEGKVECREAGNRKYLVYYGNGKRIDLLYDLLNKVVSIVRGVSTGLALPEHIPQLLQWKREGKSDWWIAKEVARLELEATFHPVAFYHAHYHGENAYTRGHIRRAIGVTLITLAMNTGFVFGFIIGGITSFSLKTAQEISANAGHAVNIYTHALYNKIFANTPLTIGQEPGKDQSKEDNTQEESHSIDVLDEQELRYLANQIILELDSSHYIGGVGQYRGLKDFIVTGVNKIKHGQREIGPFRAENILGEECNKCEIFLRKAGNSIVVSGRYYFKHITVEGYWNDFVLRVPISGKKDQKIKRYVSELSAIDDRLNVGGKARSFIYFDILGLHYPDGIVVLPEAVRRIAAKDDTFINELVDFLLVRFPDFGVMPPNEMASNNVATELSDDTVLKRLLALRSSPVVSMPGILGTVLNIGSYGLLRKNSDMATIFHLKLVIQELIGYLRLMEDIPANIAGILIGRGNDIEKEEVDMLLKRCSRERHRILRELALKKAILECPDEVVVFQLANKKLADQVVKGNDISGIYPRSVLVEIEEKLLGESTRVVQPDKYVEYHDQCIGALRSEKRGALLGEIIQKQKRIIEDEEMNVIDWDILRSDDGLYWRGIRDNQQAERYYREQIERDKYRGIVAYLADRINKHLGNSYRPSAKDMLSLGLQSVATSWETDIAKMYRDRTNISYEGFPAIVVQKMVFGNLNDNSASGVAFTRDPNTGEKHISGSFIVNAQGSELVSGERAGEPLDALKDRFPNPYKILAEALPELEQTARFPQEVEFTIQNGEIYFLQTRNIGFAPSAEINYLEEAVENGVVSPMIALSRIEELQKKTGLRKTFKVKQKIARHVIGAGLCSTPGAMTGELVFNVDNARKLAAEGKAAILLLREASKDSITQIYDLPQIGIITTYGDISSHEAVLTRLSGIPSIINVDAQLLTNLKEGQFIIIDGDRNEICTSDTRDVLLEDSSVMDASFGIDITEYEKEFIRNTFRIHNIPVDLEKVTEGELKVLNLLALQEYQSIASGDDKRAIFVANLKKHILHKLLMSKMQGSEAIYPYEKEVIKITDELLARICVELKKHGVPLNYARISEIRKKIERKLGGVRGRWYYCEICELKFDYDLNGVLVRSRNLHSEQGSKELQQFNFFVPFPQEISNEMRLRSEHEHEYDVRNEYIETTFDSLKTVFLRCFLLPGASEILEKALKIRTEGGKDASFYLEGGHPDYGLVYEKYWVHFFFHDRETVIKIDNMEMHDHMHVSSKLIRVANNQSVVKQTADNAESTTDQPIATAELSKTSDPGNVTVQTTNIQATPDNLVDANTQVDKLISVICETLITQGKDLELKDDVIDKIRKRIISIVYDELNNGYIWINPRADIRNVQSIKIDLSDDEQSLVVGCYDSIHYLTWDIGHLHKGSFSVQIPDALIKLIDDNLKKGAGGNIDFQKGETYSGSLEQFLKEEQCLSLLNKILAAKAKGRKVAGPYNEEWHEYNVTYKESRTFYFHNDEIIILKQEWTYHDHIHYNQALLRIKDQKEGTSNGGKIAGFEAPSDQSSFQNKDLSEDTVNREKIDGSEVPNYFPSKRRKDFYGLVLPQHIPQVLQWKSEGKTDWWIAKEVARLELEATFQPIAFYRAHYQGENTYKGGRVRRAMGVALITVAMYTGFAFGFVTGGITSLSLKTAQETATKAGHAANIYTHAVYNMLSGAPHVIDKHKIAELRESTKEILDEMRADYIHHARNTTPARFRELAAQISKIIARTAADGVDTSNAVVVLPWRSALALAPGFREQGFNNFWHIGLSRDEKTLAVSQYFRSSWQWPQGRKIEQTKVIIADPMFATGNSIISTIEELLKAGVKEENISIANVVSAPEGIKAVFSQHPRIAGIITASVDERLDDKGYIVPGLGDFGDRYFEGISNEEVMQWYKQGILSRDDLDALFIKLGRKFFDSDYIYVKNLIKLFENISNELTKIPDLPVKIQLALGGSLALLAQVSSRIPIDKIGDFDIEINLSEAIAGDETSRNKLTAQFSEIINNVTQQTDIEIHLNNDLQKGSLRAKGLNRSFDVGLIHKVLGRPLSNEKIAAWHRDFLLQRFVQFNSFLWSEGKLIVPNTFSEQRKYIMRYLTHEYYFGDKSQFKMIAERFLRVEESEYQNIVHAIVASGRVGLLNKALSTESFSDVIKAIGTPVVVSDLDGTLTEKDGLVCPDEAIRRIIDILRTGTRFVVLTSNIRRNVDKILIAGLERAAGDDKSVLKGLYILMENGIETVHFEQSVGRWITRRKAATIGNEVTGELIKRIEHFNRANSAQLTYEAIDSHFFLPYDENNEHMRQFAGEVVEYLRSIPRVAYYHQKSKIDVYPLGHDKSSALMEITKELRVKADSIIYLGDGFTEGANDRAILGKAEVIVNVGEKLENISSNSKYFEAAKNNVAGTIHYLDLIIEIASKKNENTVSENKIKTSFEDDMAGRFAQYLSAVGPASIISGRIPTHALELLIEALYHGQRETPIRQIAPRLEGVNYVRSSGRFSDAVKEEIVTLGKLGINGYYIAPLPQERATEGMIRLSEAVSSKVEVPGLDGGKLVDVYAEEIERGDGRASWLLYYDAGENATPDFEIQAPLSVAAWMKNNPRVQEALGVGSDFKVDVFETDNPLSHIETADRLNFEFARTKVFAKTVFVLEDSESVEENRIRQAGFDKDAARKMFDVRMVSEDGLGKLHKIENALKRKTAEQDYMLGDPVFSSTIDLTRFDGGLPRLGSEAFLGELESMHLDTVVLKSLGHRDWQDKREELKEMLAGVHRKKIRVAFDQVLESADRLELKRALQEILSKMALDDEAFNGVRLDFSALNLSNREDVENIVVFMSELKKALNRVNPDIMVGAILPENFRFADADRKKIYETLGIKEVVRFLPGERPQVSGATRGIWLEMSLEKTTDRGVESFNAEFRDIDAFKADLGELFKAQGVGVFGVDFEILKLGKNLFSDNASRESFADYCMAQVEDILKTFAKDPAYQYKEGHSDGFAIEGKKLDGISSDLRAKAIELINRYRSGDDMVTDGLHEMLLLLSETEEKEKPSFGSEEEKERYIAYAAGYLYGVLEAFALKTYLDENRPFINVRHKDLFGRMIVEAELTLKTPHTGTLNEMVEGLKKTGNTPTAELVESLARIREIDARVAQGARIGEVYPLVISSVNELQTIVDKDGADNVPLAVAELLRILDVYADRDEKTVVDRVRQKALDALPAAMKSIAGAA